jgi:hypothetical protein
MATKNDVTGDSIRSKLPSKAYSDNWERIFGKKKKKSSKLNTENSSEPNDEQKDTSA